MRGLSHDESPVEAGPACFDEVGATMEGLVTAAFFEEEDSNDEAEERENRSQEELERQICGHKQTIGALLQQLKAKEDLIAQLRDSTGHSPHC